MRRLGLPLAAAGAFRVGVRRQPGPADRTHVGVGIGPARETHVELLEARGEEARDKRDLAELTASDELSGGECPGREVARVTDHEVEVCRPGPLVEITRVCGPDGHRLLDQDMEAGVERAPGDLVMRCVRRRDDERIEARVGDELGGAMKSIANPVVIARRGEPCGIGVGDSCQECGFVCEYCRDVRIGGPRTSSSHADSNRHRFAARR